MPTKRKTTKAAEAAAAALPPIPKELIDQFVTGPMSAKASGASGAGEARCARCCTWPPRWPCAITR
jgi:hypothetical protein